jgi:hypothetical protein
VRRIQPTFHRRWHVESGCCPISKNKLPGTEGGRPTGQRDNEDILRHVRSIDNGLLLDSRVVDLPMAYNPIFVFSAP